MGHMNIKGIRTQADLYCLFKKIVAEKPRFDEVAYTKVELEYRVRPSRRSADLVLFMQEQDKEETPFLVIETKRSKRQEDRIDLDQEFWHSELGFLRIGDALAQGIWDKGSYKYHLGALQQAKEYAEALGAPFFAVCYANSFFIRSFVELHGLYYSIVDLTEEFGSRLLRDLALLYKKVEAVQHT